MTAVDPTQRLALLALLHETEPVTGDELWFAFLRAMEAALPSAFLGAEREKAVRLMEAWFEVAVRESLAIGQIRAAARDPHGVVTAYLRTPAGTFALGRHHAPRAA